MPTCPLREEKSLSQRAFSIYTDIRKLQDKAKTSYTVFAKSYCAVLLEGAVIVLACIIFSVFASSPPVVNPDAAAVTQVWAYIGELVFNMLVLVGAVKMSDRIIREMMGL